MANFSLRFRSTIGQGAREVRCPAAVSAIAFRADQQTCQNFDQAKWLEFGVCHLAGVEKSLFGTLPRCLAVHECYLLYLEVVDLPVLWRNQHNFLPRLEKPVV
jgi:hypothetical protein